MFEKWMESLQRVKLKGGVFGKATLLCVVLVLGVCAVCFKANIWWLSLPLVGAMIGLVWYTVKRLFDFADRYPKEAIMDGAEFVQLARVTQQSKEGAVRQLDPATDHPLIDGENAQRDDAADDDEVVIEHKPENKA